MTPSMIFSQKNFKNLLNPRITCVQVSIVYGLTWGSDTYEIDTQIDIELKIGNHTVVIPNQTILKIYEKIKILLPDISLFTVDFVVMNCEDVMASTIKCGYDIMHHTKSRNSRKHE